MKRRVFTQQVSVFDRQQFQLRSLLFSRQMTPRSFFMNKRKMPLKFLQKKQQQANYRQISQSLGIKSSQYLKKRIKHFSQHLTNSMSHKFRDKNLSTIGSTKQRSSPMTSQTLTRQMSDRCRSQQDRNSYEKAHLMIEKQRFQRLITRRNQQQKDFESISEVIKLKMMPKKLKLQLQNPKPLQHNTWYQKWINQVKEGKKRKQFKIKKKRNGVETWRKTNRYYMETIQI